MPPHLIAVGTSAGGVLALSEFVSCLPANLPAPIVVVQHLPKDHRSLLREVLQRRTTLEVKWAQDGAPLRGGTVTLTRPDRYTQVSVGPCLTLSARIPDLGLRCPADVLFRSVAESFGAGAIGIVMTGCLADGASGSRAIRSAGGRVFAQDPDCCQHSDMPIAAMQTGGVDLFLSVRALAAAVTAITMVPGASRLLAVGEGYRTALAERARTRRARYSFRVNADEPGLTWGGELPR